MSSKVIQMNYLSFMLKTLEMMPKLKTVMIKE